MQTIIAGIQQIGIGVPKVHEAFTWYRRHLGMDIPIFEEAAEANLMLPYTGGKPQQRHAILAINIRGGGGFEIWQYTSRTPQEPLFTPQLGDYGIFVTRIKSSDVKGAYEFLKQKKVNLLGDVTIAPDGKPHFFLKDPYYNIFEIVTGDDWFGSASTPTGGPSGCMIGVSDIEKSKKFYADILGYDQVIYDETQMFPDLAVLPGGHNKVRRVLLTHSQPRKGSFSRLLGSSKIELIQGIGNPGKKIFEGRFWGDMGFIHLCFDINGMKALKEKCTKLGYPFTVESNPDFDMGEAAGQFSYIEDPDGTLIEFVETHRIPILKKLNWYLDLRKRNPEKALPNWMLKALKMNRLKD
jgi:catechol 2,3-dioxygenase-like lactoylglutathione lyase family enzyme